MALTKLKNRFVARVSKIQAHGFKVWTHQRLAGHLKTTDATADVMQRKQNL